VAVTSAEPYANHLHLTPDRQPRQHLMTQFFTGWILFLTPNQQCQSSEGNNTGLTNIRQMLTRFFTAHCFVSNQDLHLCPTALQLNVLPTWWSIPKWRKEES